MPKNLNTQHVTHRTTKEHLSDDLKFLIACCQTEPSENDINFIHSYLLELISNTPVVKTKEGCSTINQLLITAALQHGILPLVYKTIKNLSPSDPPRSSHNTSHVTRNTESQSDSYLSTLLSELKTQYMIIAQRNMLMTSELIRIVKLLKENNIEALAFKGPTLSQMAYGDITLRQYGDLDILVKKENIYKIDSLLKDLGYQRLLKLTPIQEKVYIQNSQDLGFYHPKSAVLFEMHWSLLNEDYPLKINLDTIWKTPQTININQQKIKTFPTEELLMYLCIHGSKHLWERIEWIKDIDLLIRKEDIDWEKIIKKIDGSGFEVMIYLGLSLSMQLFNTPLPKNITDHISNMESLNTLSVFVLQSWQDPKNVFQETHTMLKFFPGIKEKSLYLHKILIKPSLNDYWFVDLPKSLYWVYYFVHPYLLLKKYFPK